MANIRKETGRHDWRPQRIPQIRKKGVLSDDPNRMKLLCWNCRMPFDPETMGPVPVTGCYRETKFPMSGKETQEEAYRQEDRKRKAEIRAKQAHEDRMEHKLQEYLEDLARRLR